MIWMNCIKIFCSLWVNVCSPHLLFFHPSFYILSTYIHVDYVIKLKLFDSRCITQVIHKIISCILWLIPARILPKNLTQYHLDLKIWCILCINYYETRLSLRAGEVISQAPSTAEKWQTDKRFWNNNPTIIQRALYKQLWRINNPHRSGTKLHRRRTRFYLCVIASRRKVRDRSNNSTAERRKVNDTMASCRKGRNDTCSKCIFRLWKMERITGELEECTLL